MPTAVFPGSFDPPTLGHLDLVTRAAALFDRVVIGVLRNESKSELFSVAERVEMLTDVTGDLASVEVDAFRGLLVDFCRRHGATVIVRGARSAADVDYEIQMARMNRALANVETVLLAARPDLSFVASSLVKEVARLGGDVSALVPPAVTTRLADRLGIPTEPRNTP